MRRDGGRSTAVGDPPKGGPVRSSRLTSNNPALGAVEPWQDELGGQLQLLVLEH